MYFIRERERERERTRERERERGERKRERERKKMKWERRMKCLWDGHVYEIFLSALKITVKFYAIFYNFQNC